MARQGESPSARCNLAGVVEQEICGERLMFGGVGGKERNKWAAILRAPGLPVEKRRCVDRTGLEPVTQEL